MGSCTSNGVSDTTETTATRRQDHGHSAMDEWHAEQSGVRVEMGDDDLSEEGRPLGILPAPRTVMDDFSPVLPARRPHQTQDASYPSTAGSASSNGDLPFNPNSAGDANGEAMNASSAADYGASTAVMVSSDNLAAVVGDSLNRVHLPAASASSPMAGPSITGDIRSGLSASDQSPTPSGSDPISNDGQVPQGGSIGRSGGLGAGAMAGVGIGSANISRPVNAAPSPGPLMGSSGGGAAAGGSKSKLGAREMVGHFSALSTFCRRPEKDAQRLLVQYYRGGFSEGNTYWPTVQERYVRRIGEVNAGQAVGEGLLWFDSSRGYMPVPLRSIPILGYELNPYGQGARMLVSNLEAISNDLRRLEEIMEGDVNYEEVGELSENLYIRALNLHLSRLSATFLELLIRARDMACLQGHRDEFFKALKEVDVNALYDSFFANRRTTEEAVDDLFAQYVELELTEIVAYTICVAWTTIDETRVCINNIMSAAEVAA